MSILSLKGGNLKRFLRGAAESIRENVDELNRIDKFPFADRDTGSNMYITINSVTEALMNNENQNISYIASAASRAALKNAKGNSGIILAQIIKGFEKAAEGNESIGAVEFAKSFYYAADFVNKSVLYKRKNTMCSLIKDIANCVMDTCLVTDDIGEIIAAGAGEAEERLLGEEETDSGAKGLFYFMKGGMEALLNNTEYKLKEKSFVYRVKIELCKNISKGDIEKLFEGIGKVNGFSGENQFTLLTNYPLKIAEKIACLDVKKLLIEKGENDEKAKKEYSFAVFSSEDGSKEIFSKTGIDNIINRCSDEKADEILRSIKADCIFVLSDSRENYKRALRCCEKNKNTLIIETKSLPEVIWAMTGFSETKSPDDNKYSMTECVISVMTGMVEEINNKDDSREYMLTVEDREVSKESSSVIGVKKLAEIMLNEKTNAGIAAVFYSENVNEEEINDLTAFVSEKYKNVDIEIHKGTQSKFRYVIGVV